MKRVKTAPTSLEAVKHVLAWWYSNYERPEDHPSIKECDTPIPYLDISMLETVVRNEGRVQNGH